MTGLVVIDLINVFTPVFYLGILFSPFLFKKFLFRSESDTQLNDVDKKIVYIKILKKSKNPFTEDVTKIVILENEIKTIFNIETDSALLADYIRSVIRKKQFVVTFTDRTYLTLKHILRNYISFDKKSINHINIYNSYLYTYKEDIPIEWRKTLSDYKNMFSCILFENFNDLSLLHTISR